MRVALLALVLLTGCLRDHLVECGTQLCPVDRVCAPNGSCVAPEQLTACSGIADGLACTYDDRQGHCQTGVCEASACGDATLDSPEQCDGPDLGGATCLTYGYYNPDGLSCAADCSVDTSQCVGKCGDGITNGPELCDMTPGDVFTCYEVGFDYGSVRCSPQLCAPVYDQCVTIGLKESAQSGDYSMGAYSPRRGDVYIVDAGGGTENYLHVTGVGRLTIARPEGCNEYNASIWVATSDEVFLTNSATVCEQVGSTWTMWPMPQGVTVQRIWGRSATDVYAVGSAVVHFDGVSWSVVNTGAPAGSTFTTITSRVGGKVVIGTSDGGVAIFDQSWTYDVVDAGTGISSAWVSPNGTVYATGYDKLYTRKNGAWTTSIPAPLTRVRAVTGVSDAGVYLWAEAPDGIYSGLWFFDGQTTYYLGPIDELSYFGGGAESLLAIAAYSRFYESSGYFFTPKFDTGQLSAMWAFGPADIIAINQVGTLWRYDGLTWTATSPFPSGTPMRSMWAANPNAIVAVGYSGATATFDGVSWTIGTVTPAVPLDRVWGESATRVFAAGIEYSTTVLKARIFEFDGASWKLVFTAPVNSVQLIGMWGSPSTGTFILGDASDKMFHLPPGAASTDWTEITLPNYNPIGIWGAGNQVVITFTDGRAFAYENGTFTEIPARGLAAARELTGSAGDMFGVSTLYTLVHWDGTVWDRVRAPPDFASGVNYTFAGNGVVAVSDTEGVSLLVRP